MLAHGQPRDEQLAIPALKLCPSRVSREWSARSSDSGALYTHLLTRTTETMERHMRHTCYNTER